MPVRPLRLGFAHRGARLEHPDNSLAGFARALELGARALETDVWATADGAVVLDHDGVIGHGPWRRRIATLRARDLPPHLPRVEELYEQVDPGIDLSVDVKDPTAAAPLVRAAGHAGASSRLWLCSPDRAALTTWRTLDPDVHLVHSTAMSEVAGARHPYRDLAPAELSSRVAAHASALHGDGVDTVNLHHRSWSPATVASVRDQGLRAFGWDVQRRPDLVRAIDLGLDGVYSDHVALMVEVLASEEPQ